MKVESFYVKTVLEACERLKKLPGGPETMVLMTGRLYEEFKKVGSKQGIDNQLPNGDTSLNAVETIGVYSIHTVSFVQLALTKHTSLVGVVAFDFKRFEGFIEKNLYVLDLCD